MRFDPSRCPECGELATGILEEIPNCVAELSPPQAPEDEFEYAGSTEVNWDGQMPMRDAAYGVTLTDGSHEWSAVASGNDVSYGITAPLALRTSLVRSTEPEVDGDPSPTPVAPNPPTCEECDGLGWILAGLPIRGVDAAIDGAYEIERCDACQKYRGDMEAAAAWSASGLGYLAAVYVRTGDRPAGLNDARRGRP
jgi:hypothetical protein